MWNERSVCGWCAADVPVRGVPEVLHERRSQNDLRATRFPRENIPWQIDQVIPVDSRDAARDREQSSNRTARRNGGPRIRRLLIHRDTSEGVLGYSRQSAKANR
jgi:hypothetical protein